MLYLSFILGFILYSFGAYLSNSPIMKLSAYYMPLAILTGVFCNFLWFSMAKAIKDNSEVLMLGFYWDVMIVSSFVLVPILFFQVNLSLYKIIGLALIFSGIIFTKL